MLRTIYCLQFDLETDDGATRQMVVWLDPAGQSTTAQAVPPVKRIIDLRPGNWLRHGGKVSRTIDVKAYRALNSPDEWGPSRDGYTYRLKPIRLDG